MTGFVFPIKGIIILKRPMGMFYNRSKVDWNHMSRSLNKNFSFGIGVFKSFKLLDRSGRK